MSTMYRPTMASSCPSVSASTKRHRSELEPGTGVELEWSGCAGIIEISCRLCCLLYDDDITGHVEPKIVLRQF